MTRDQAMSILSLGEGYTDEDLKKAYREKAKKYHPDRVGTGETNMFITIKKAYDFLLVSGKNERNSLYTHQSIFSIVMR